MKKFSPAFILAPAALLLSACATPAAPEADPATAATAEAEADSTCLRNINISGFSTIDDRHILVTAPTRSKTYLLTTMGRCMDLDRTNQIYIDSRSMACVTKFDRIKFTDSAIYPGSCPIKSIDRVADRDAAKTLIKAREGADDSDDAAEATES